MKQKKEKTNLVSCVVEREQKRKQGPADRMNEGGEVHTEIASNSCLAKGVDHFLSWARRTPVHAKLRRCGAGTQCCDERKHDWRFGQPEDRRLMEGFGTKEADRPNLIIMAT